MLGAGFSRPETAPQAGPEDRFHHDTAPLLPQGLPSCRSGRRSGRGLLPVLLQLRLPAAAKSPPTLEPPTTPSDLPLSVPAPGRVCPPLRVSTSPLHLPSSARTGSGRLVLRPPHAPQLTRWLPPRLFRHSSPRSLLASSSPCPGSMRGPPSSRQHGRPSPATPLLLATGHPLRAPTLIRVPGHLPLPAQTGPGPPTRHPWVTLARLQCRLARLP